MTLPTKADATPRLTQLENGSYQVSVPAWSASLEVDRLRRDRHELIGELTVRCDLPGTQGYDGVVSIADFNLSSARTRSDRAKLIARRTHAEELDWEGLIEYTCQAIILAERAGTPAVDLRNIAPREQDTAILDTEGFIVPRHHPAILFGDGGTGKSYLALWVAGRAEEAGLRVGYFDWELAGADHRRRLEALFGRDMPRVLYVRCERPLLVEADRLRRVVREAQIDYAVYDSVAFACDGPPENAEVAAAYFRAVRQIGIGSLHIAHTNRSEHAAQKPFGSVFWHNSARSTWHIKAAESLPDEEGLRVGLYEKKANLDRRRKPVGYELRFDGPVTRIRRFDPADEPELALALPLRYRLQLTLRREGPRSPILLAADLDADARTIERTARRYRDAFRVLPGGQIPLVGS